MEAARFFVSGRVQGVGFRASARARAIALGLSGYVRNLPDGRVEAFAQGEPVGIASFALWLQHGPPLARVNDVQRSLAAIEAVKSFVFG